MMVTTSENTFSSKVTDPFRSINFDDFDDFDDNLTSFVSAGLDIPNRTDDCSTVAHVTVEPIKCSLKEAAEVGTASTDESVDSLQKHFVKNVRMNEDERS